MSTLLNYRETDPVLRMLLLRWRIVLILSFDLNLFGGFRETLNKCVFYGEPAQLCDAGINTIKVLASLIVLWKFPHLFNQRFIGTGGQTVKIRQRLPRLPEHFFRQ